MTEHNEGKTGSHYTPTMDKKFEKLLAHATYRFIISTSEKATSFFQR
jgi:hypothetical protein